MSTLYRTRIYFSNADPINLDPSSEEPTVIEPNVDNPIMTINTKTSTFYVPYGVLLGVLIFETEHNG
jgi:hypothetical protein